MQESQNDKFNDAVGKTINLMAHSGKQSVYPNSNLSFYRNENRI